MSETAQSTIQEKRETAQSKFPELDRICTLQRENLQVLKNRTARERINAIDKIRVFLADPRNPEMQKKLNLKIKYREGFRPFAPSVLE